MALTYGQKMYHQMHLSREDSLAYRDALNHKTPSLPDNDVYMFHYGEWKYYFENY